MPGRILRYMGGTAVKATRRTWTWSRNSLRVVLQLNDTPERIALGTALGVFVAMTPTVGVQMAAVTLLNTVCRANRMAGLVMVYLSNPLTMVPIYWADYWIGAKILAQDVEAGRAAFEALLRFENQTFAAQTMEFFGKLGSIGSHVVVPMFLGGAVLGVVLGLPSYPLALRFVRRYRGLRDKVKEAIREHHLHQDPPQDPPPDGGGGLL